MRLLLDSHALLRVLTDESRLPPDTVDRIADPRSLVVMSAATVWELGIKQALGKITLPGSLVEAAAASGFTTLDITPGHAVEAAALPRHHDDPFDRMLVAQARIEGLTLVTRDRRISAYGVATLPA